MSRIQKLETRFWSTPKPTDFTWQNLVTLMDHYGYDEKQGKGSRVKFVGREKGQKITLHRPHPTPVLKGYQIDDVDDVREGLIQQGAVEKDGQTDTET